MSPNPRHDAHARQERIRFLLQVIAYEEEELSGAILLPLEAHEARQSAKHELQDLIKIEFLGY